MSLHNGRCFLLVRTYAWEVTHLHNKASSVYDTTIPVKIISPLRQTQLRIWSTKLSVVDLYAGQIMKMAIAIHIYVLVVRMTWTSARNRSKT
jgi:hypothetical protein